MTRIEFFDITTHDGWISRDEAAAYQPLLISAVGKIINEDEHLLILAPLYGPDRVGYLIVVPKGCIVSRSDD